MIDEYNLSNDQLMEYVKNHKQEIQEYINAKAQRSVKRAINEAFKVGDSFYGRYDGYATKMIKKIVAHRIKEFVNATPLPIDEATLRNKLNKEVNRQIKKVKARVVISTMKGNQQ